MMSTVEIPVSSDVEHYDLQVTLDGVALTLEFRWNSRSEAWYLDLLNADGDTVASGRKLIVDWPLMLRGFRDTSEDLPRGELYTLDTSGGGVRPGRNDLGSRVRLYYEEYSS